MITTPTIILVSAIASFTVTWCIIEGIKYLLR